MRIIIPAIIVLSMFLLSLPFGMLVQGIDYKSETISISDSEARGFRVRIIRGTEINEQRDLLDWNCPSDSDEVIVLILLKDARHIWLREITIPRTTGYIIDKNTTLFKSNDVIRSGTGSIEKLSKGNIFISLKINGINFGDNYTYLSNTVMKKSSHQISSRGYLENSILNFFKWIKPTILSILITAVIAVIYSYMKSRKMNCSFNDIGLLFCLSVALELIARYVSDKLNPYAVGPFSIISFILIFEAHCWLNKKIKCNNYREATEQVI
jgi:hypothetical protein